MQDVFDLAAKSVCSECALYASIFSHNLGAKYMSASFQSICEAQIMLIGLSLKIRFFTSTEEINVRATSGQLQIESVLQVEHSTSILIHIFLIPLENGAS